MPRPVTAPVELYLADERGRPATGDPSYRIGDVEAQISVLAAAGMGTDVDPDPCPEPAPDTAWEVIDAAAAAWERDTFGATGIALHKLRGGIPTWWVTRQECRDALTAHQTQAPGTVDEQLVLLLRDAADRHGLIVETAPDRPLPDRS